jgi:hypothetical protein
VQTKYYGKNALYPTGPGLLGDLYFKGNMNKLVEDDFDLFHGIYNTYVISRRLNKYILNPYPGYREEQRKYHSGTPYYAILWKKRTVYKEIT